jgi:hypothetical protein
MPAYEASTSALTITLRFTDIHGYTADGTITYTIYPQQSIVVNGSTWWTVPESLGQRFYIFGCGGGGGAGGGSGGGSGSTFYATITNHWVLVINSDSQLVEVVVVVVVAVKLLVPMVL